MVEHMRGPSALIATIVAVFSLVSCGTEDAHRSSSATLPEPPDHVVPNDYTGPFRVSNITVLSNPEHGPQLCTYVEES